ncbi:glycosyl hydrolase [Fodinicola acaciae]|uniref:glycosyl hydrolase n=1 Tax=Fodinicola acaciae TaxID=2681555 RepID=UPI0013D35CC4|nr:glycosyl hydrolase [Fodinicola acaciae]
MPANAARNPDPLRGVAKIQAAQHARATGIHPLQRGEGEGDALEVADQAEQFAGERSAPADSVPAAALVAARAQAAGLPRAQGRATELTGQPLDAEPAGYTDPTWSNDGAGFRDVAGRTTALAVDGNTYYQGAADGGVWKSTDRGRTWRSIWDGQSTLSIGALLVAPDHSLWVGTGEANTNSDSYLGTGVYRSTDGGRSFRRVGGDELLDRQTFRLVADGQGNVYAATNQGLYRHSATTSAGAWTLVLKPDPNPTGSPYHTSIITDVVVRPGTHGQTVLAVLGWRLGTAYNGFYLSTTGGGAGSYRLINPSGAIDTTDIGRTTLAYAADGSRLYAIIQSPKRLAANGATNLQGVFVSTTGDPTGPYQKIADSDSLGASGSALQNLDGYHVGIQSWYNEALAVDPTNPLHVYVSLEEVFQSNDGGATFQTASQYWNYNLKCGDAACPPATHPDQHALALTNDGQVLIGNDGGVYRRPMTDTGYGDWTDLNDTVRTLQYYDAAAGQSGRGFAYWGGLQDNGTSALFPGQRKNIEPAGGDGGMVLVNPRDGQQAVGEYTNLAMYRTSDGGHTFTTISPECGYYADKTACDPSARFIAPFQADIHDANHWVAAGNKVWDSTRGWDTTCATTCDWTPVHGFGLDAAGGYNVGTALAVSGVVTYAAWVDSGANPSPSFASGIDTNYGGSWHRIASPVLPNRFVAGLTVDPANPAHVYAVYNGYSRRWIPGGGLGTVFESTDGGSSWRNVSGNLPDAPGDGLAVIGGKLVLGTDIGLFVADQRHPAAWSRLGALPNVVVTNVRTVPGRAAVVVATHGRGIWQVTLS